MMHNHALALHMQDMQWKWHLCECLLLRCVAECLPCGKVTIRSLDPAIDQLGYGVRGKPHFGEVKIGVAHQWKGGRVATRVWSGKPWFVGLAAKLGAA